jgi:hypothetical protein
MLLACPFFPFLYVGIPVKNLNPLIRILRNVCLEERRRRGSVREHGTGRELQVLETVQFCPPHSSFIDSWELDQEGRAPLIASLI